MKIFITGATGFVGSHLVAKLSQQHLVHVMVSDLLDFHSVGQELLQANPDIVVHLAARTEVEKSFYEQIAFSQINYVGTVNLIEKAKQCKKLQNFVFASTMEVYGWQPISDCVEHSLPFVPVVFDENTVPQPNAPYAVAKYACEKYLAYMHRSEQFPYTALRQTNSYGRRDNDFFVTENIISQMLTNADHCYLGNPLPYRNFLFVDDLINAWSSVIENPDRCRGKIFTLGPDHVVQIKDYAQKIADKIGWKGHIHWHTKPHRPGEIYWLNSSSALIKETIGWYPKHSLDQGLDKTIELWQNKLTQSST